MIAGMGRLTAENRLRCNHHIANGKAIIAGAPSLLGRVVGYGDRVGYFFRPRPKHSPEENRLSPAWRIVQCRALAWIAWDCSWGHYSLRLPVDLTPMLDLRILNQPMRAAEEFDAPKPLPRAGAAVFVLSVRRV